LKSEYKELKSKYNLKKEVDRKSKRKRTKMEGNKVENRKKTRFKLEDNINKEEGKELDLSKYLNELEECNKEENMENNNEDSDEESPLFFHNIKKIAMNSKLKLEDDNELKMNLDLDIPCDGNNLEIKKEDNEKDSQQGCQIGSKDGVRRNLGLFFDLTNLEMEPGSYSQ
jgi:hypothetical protein